MLTSDTINFFDMKGMFVRHYDLGQVMAFVKTQGVPSEIAIIINDGKDFRFGGISVDQVAEI